MTSYGVVRLHMQPYELGVTVIEHRASRYDMAFEARTTVTI
jgi:hypothetical protein